MEVFINQFWRYDDREARRLPRHHKRRQFRWSQQRRYQLVRVEDDAHRRLISARRLPGVVNQTHNGFIR